jgi:hypothetical protein
MKHRSPAAVFLLSLVTLGIYSIVWQVKTKNELNRQGAEIPTAWLIIIPLANLWWAWKYAEGVEKVSKGKVSAILTLILMLLLSIVGLAILQSEFNKLSDVVTEPAVSPEPTTAVAPVETSAEAPESEVAEPAAPVESSAPEVAASDESPNDESPTPPTAPTAAV